MRIFRMQRREMVALLTAVTWVMTAQAAWAQLVPGFAIERISIGLDGDDANDRSELPAINFDGSVVAFKSAAFNLIANDTNGQIDVFAFDRAAGVTERIPRRAETEGEANGESYPPALDAAGRIVAFGSAARNLVRGDFNQFPDLYAYDRTTQTTENLSLVFDENDEGRLGGRVPDLAPSVSADGNLVAFTSGAPHFTDIDRNEAFDVFVYDRAADTVELISITNLSAAGSRSGNGPSSNGVISANGRFVVFCSDASNLVQGGPNGVAGIFRRDRETAETIQVGSLVRGACAQREVAPAISADGETIAFSSDLALDGEDGNGTWDVFLWTAGGLTKISRSFEGGDSDGSSTYASLSADGRFIAYQTTASNIVPDDNNGVADVIVYDSWTGQTRRVSITADGNEAGFASGAPQLSGDGITVVFQSRAALVEDDDNNVLDIYAVTNTLSFTPTPTETSVPTETPVPTEIQTATPTRTPTLGGSATPDRSRTVGTATPVATTAVPTATTPSAQATTPSGGGTPTRTATAIQTPTTSSNSGGGGGGCSCRIDQDASQGAGMWLLTMVPALLLARRTRRSV